MDGGGKGGKKRGKKGGCVRLCCICCFCFHSGYPAAVFRGGGFEVVGSYDVLVFFLNSLCWGFSGPGHVVAGNRAGVEAEGKSAEEWEMEGVTLLATFEIQSLLFLKKGPFVLKCETKIVL